NMPKGVTDMTLEVWNLHMLIFWICVVLGVGVFGTMLYSVIRHRKSREAKGYKPSHFHENTLVEVIWTTIPFLILIGVAIPAAGTLVKLEDTDNPDMSIRVTGYQWLWEYEYVESGVHFYSRLDDESMRARAFNSIQPDEVDNYLLEVDNRVVIPKGQKVRLLITSGDVIHSWWVPELSGKKDAVPGYINEIWINANETGIYRGQCAELCGRGHAYMPIVVEVVQEDEFDDWVSQKTVNAGDNGASTSDSANDQSQPDDGDEAESADDDDQEEGADDAAESTAEDESGDAEDMSEDDLMALGEKVYGNICAACHQDDGSGVGDTFPALADNPVVTSGPVEEHVGQILNGAGAMPAYADMLSNEEIAAVTTYERNAFGNDSGDIVQPAEVESLR